MIKYKNIEKLFIESIFSTDEWKLLSMRAGMLWMYFTTRTDIKTMKCFPSYSTISSDCKIRRQSIKKYITELEDAGLLKVYQNKSYNEYVVIHPLFDYDDIKKPNKKYTKKEKRAYADKLRENPTPAELHVKTLLDELDIKYKFNEVLLGFIPDFIVDKTIIEVDGGIHLKRSVKANDARKDKAFKAKGYNVVRITNDDAFKLDSESLSKILKQTS